MLESSLQFKQDGKDLDKFVKFGEQYPYAFPLWFGPFVCILNIHHPDYVRTILASAEPKDDIAYHFIQSWIGKTHVIPVFAVFVLLLCSLTRCLLLSAGNGLLVSSGQKWFLHRRLLTPGFHYDVLKPYTKLMSDSTKTMLVWK